MYIIICGYAVSKFEKMAKLFEERNDPRLHLEKRVKMPLFTKFKNQYQQTIAEEAIAETICAFLEEPIKIQVQKYLSARVVTKMIDTEYYFANKSALKVKILNDLRTDNKFEKYMVYVEHFETCLKEKIKECTEKYCDEVPTKGSVNTRLQIIAKEEVDRLIKVVKKVVSETNQLDARMWLNMFCGEASLRTELGVQLIEEDLLISFNSLHDLNLDNFKESITDGLEQLKRRFRALFDKIESSSDIWSWTDKCLSDLLKKLIGCTEKCPFCGEQCDLLEHDSAVEHRTEVHRVSCLAGWKNKYSNEMEISICPSLIDSDKDFQTPEGGYHPYNDYKKIHTTWSITRDMTSKHSSYWKWFIGEYKEKLAKHFKADASSIPSSWKDYTQQMIKEDVAAAYNIEYRK